MESDSGSGGGDLFEEDDLFEGAEEMDEGGGDAWSARSLEDAAFLDDSDDDEDEGIYGESALGGEAFRLAEYDRALIEAVWEEAAEVPGVDPALWRQDSCGDWIYRYDYGKRQSRFGWRIHDPGSGRRGTGDLRAIHVANAADRAA